MASLSLSHPAYFSRHPRANPGALIPSEDIDRMYRWFQTVTPISLIYKVWFDVTYYFMLTESDIPSMLEMRRDSFIMCVDENQRRYIALKNQQMFNSLADMTDGSRMQLRMYEMKGSPRCPVASLLKYMRHIHPALLRIWQRPRETYRPSEPGVWYDMFPLGLTRLGRMMPQLSRLAGLSVTYRACHVHNTALRHLELGGVPPLLLRELRGRRGPNAERAERGACRSDGRPCGATANCRRGAEQARKRAASEMEA